MPDYFDLVTKYDKNFTARITQNKMNICQLSSRHTSAHPILQMRALLHKLCIYPREIESIHHVCTAHKTLGHRHAVATTWIPSEPPRLTCKGTRVHSFLSAIISS